MRGRPMGRSDVARRKPDGGEVGRFSGRDRRGGGAPFRGRRGGGEFREPRREPRDTGRRPENRDQFRRPNDGPYERGDTRRPPFENEGSFRDNRRPPPAMEPRIERRPPPQNDYRPMRENFRGSSGYPPEEFHEESRPPPRSLDVKHRGDGGAKPPHFSRDPPSALSRLSPKKRPLEKRPGGDSPLGNDDLRKRLRRSFRSKSPANQDFEANARKDRPEFRGPEENVQFNRSDLRKLQIRITKPPTSPPSRRFEEPPSRRPASPEPMYGPRDGDRGRARPESFVKGPYREPNQSWDNDIAMHRMKTDFGRRNAEPEIRKPYHRDEIQRDAIPDRRGPEDRRGPDRSDAVRPRGGGGGGRGLGRDRRDRPGPGGDRGRFESHPPQDQRDRGRLPPREPPRYDMPPRRAQPQERPRNAPGYAPYGRESDPAPMYDYPPRRPMHNQAY